MTAWEWRPTPTCTWRRRARVGHVGAIARSTAPMGVGGYSASGWSASTQQSICERWRKALPRVRGMRAFDSER